MTKIEVADIVKKSLVKLVILDKKTGRVRGQGSGVVVNNLGFILTAYHVVVQSVKDDSQIILAIPYGGGSVPYSLIFGGISFQIGDQKHISPTEVDLAILAPMQHSNIPPITLAEYIPTEGAEVILAGFPEDLKSPLDIAEKFSKEAVGSIDNLTKIKEFSKSFIPWIMVKHGIIGGVFHIVSPNIKSELLGEENSFTLRAAEYWVDNTYARGASGGPAVDMEGKLLGIIIESGETIVSDFMDTISFPVPSGTVRVLSQKLLSWSLAELEKQWKPRFIKNKL